jgi:hypothetical protein
MEEMMSVHKNVIRKGWTIVLGFTLIFFLSMLLPQAVYADDSLVPEVPAEANDAEAVLTNDLPDTIEANEGDALQPSTGEDGTDTTDSEGSPAGDSEVVDEEDAAEGSDSDLEGAASPDVPQDALAEDSTGETETGEVEIVITNEEGETVEMASPEGQEVVSSADPWWIVGTLKYAIVKTGGICPADAFYCEFADSPITYALNYMDANNLVPTDGILHVESDTYNEGTITIDGSSGNGYLANLKGLVSEWTSSDTFIIGDVFIRNTISGFTLNGFTIDGHLVFQGNIGTLTLIDVEVSDPSEYGIQIDEHNGAVNIDRVKSSNNGKFGMYLENLDGIGNVTVTNSEFNHNGSLTHGIYWAGMEITTNGLVTLNGVSASDNYGNGAQISAIKGTTIKNCVFSDNTGEVGSMSSGNGLYFNETSLNNHVLLENVYADNNTNYGIYLINAGNITLKNVSADANSFGHSFDGVYVQNTAGTGAVTITNSNSNNNGGLGFTILSMKNVLINGITASDNDSSGVYLDNCRYDSGSGICLGTGLVTISGNIPNYFNNNNGNGIEIVSGGNVTLSYFMADENISSGVVIQNNFSGRSGNVTLNLTYKPVIGTWQNSASKNGVDGVSVESFGNILVDRLLAETNDQTGADLDNSGSPTAKTVIVKNSEFSSNPNTGLNISSLGNVTVTDVDGSKNGYGMIITNFSGTGNVVITGTKNNICHFSENSGSGIFILTSGTVLLKNIEAISDSEGAYINNRFADGKAVTITSADFSESTNGNGFSISSYGAVTLTDIISNGNVNGTGALISNSGGGKAQVVKITRGQFLNNLNDGLLVDTYGTVTLTNINASGNGAYGAYIDNCVYDGGIPGCKGSGSISIIGIDNQFSENTFIGLYLSTKGNVNLLNIVADDNDSSGLVIDNARDNCLGNITINAAGGKTNSFSGNGNYGVRVQSLGNITLQRILVNNNNYYGVWLSNSSGPANKKVTLAYAEINDNQMDGLYIACTGPVTLTSVQVLRSSKHFWEIDSSNGEKITDRLPYNAEYDEIWYLKGGIGQHVELLLSSDFFDPYLELFDENWVLLIADDNGGTGTEALINYSLPADGTYYIRVSSAVSGGYGKYILGMTGSNPSNSDYSSFMGVNINNTYNNGTGNVTITAPKGGYGLDVRDNNYTGVYIHSCGNIAIAGSTISYNGYRGATLGNDNVDGKSVTLKDTSFDFNAEEGVNIQTKGAITWTNGSASNNRGSEGATIINYSAGTYRPVNLSNLSFDGNATSGFSVMSIGAITLKNVGASNNLGGNGATLDNCMNSGGCTGVGNVTLSGTLGMSNFSGNSIIGLSINSAGNISLTNVNASDNAAYSGLALYNNYSNAYGNILVKNSAKNAYNDYSGNGGYGAEMYSYGTITLSNISAKENGGSGLYVNNSVASSAKNVTLSRIISADNEGDAGITVSSKGAITLSYVDDRGNDSNGIRLSNSGASSAQAVIVTRTSVDGNASGYGLYIQSIGDVTLNNVSALNSMYGAYIDNSTSPSAKVTVLGTLGQNTFSENEVDGLTVVSNGNVSLTSVVADNNGRRGVFADAGGTLTAANLWTSKNGYQGLDLLAGSSATISNAQCFSNGATDNEDGMRVRVGTNGTVKILNSVFVGNYGSGIAVSGTSSPILVNTLYFGNDADGSGDTNLYIIP